MENNMETTEKKEITSIKLEAKKPNTNTNSKPKSKGNRNGNGNSNGNGKNPNHKGNSKNFTKKEDNKVPANKLVKLSDITKKTNLEKFQLKQTKIKTPKNHVFMVLNDLSELKSALDVRKALDKVGGKVEKFKKK